MTAGLENAHFSCRELGADGEFRVKASCGLCLQGSSGTHTLEVRTQPKDLTGSLGAGLGVAVHQRGAPVVGRPGRSNYLPATGARKHSQYC